MNNPRQETLAIARKEFVSDLSSDLRDVINHFDDAYTQLEAAESQVDVLAGISVIANLSNYLSAKALRGGRFCQPSVILPTTEQHFIVDELDASTESDPPPTSGTSPAGSYTPNPPTPAPQSTSEQAELDQPEPAAAAAV